jgi:hypothetical protein
MIFNKFRKMEIIVGVKKGYSYKKQRTIIKEVGQKEVEISPDEHVLLVKLLEN